MENLSFDYQLDEFMLFCRTRQLREKTMNSYEQTLRLFERWCWEELKIQLYHIDVYFSIVISSDDLKVNAKAVIAFHNYRIIG